MKKEKPLSLPALKRTESEKKGKKYVTLADIMYKPNISRASMKEVLKAHKSKVVVTVNKCCHVIINFK